MHDFDIRQGFNETTVMFCRKCGTSFVLTQYEGTVKKAGKTTWEAMPFENDKGNPIDPPCKPCLYGEEV